MKSLCPILLIFLLASLFASSPAFADAADQLWQAAQQAFDVGELEKASSLCQEVLAEEPGHVEAERLLNLVDRVISFHEKAQAAEEQGDLAEAVEHYQAALEVNPQDLHARSRIEYLQGQLSDQNKKSREKMIRNATRDLVPVEATGFYQVGSNRNWGTGQGFLFNIDLQPEAWFHRRFHIGADLGMMFFPDARESTFDMSFVFGYQHYYLERWTPVVRASGGVSHNRGWWSPAWGLDGGMKLVLHPEFHLEALVGTSANTPFRFSLGMGTNGKYAGYAALGVLLLGLAALGG